MLVRIKNTFNTFNGVQAVHGVHQAFAITTPMACGHCGQHLRPTKPGLDDLRNRYTRTPDKTYCYSCRPFEPLTEPEPAYIQQARSATRRLLLRHRRQ